MIPTITILFKYSTLVRTFSSTTQHTRRQAHKHLHLPTNNLPSTKNLTILIKPRKNAKEEDDKLPVEIVAVGGKATKSPVREWQMPPSYRRQEAPEYHSDRSYSSHFLQSNRRLGEMIRRVEMY